MQLKAIFSIALALMFGAVIITGIYTLNQEGLQPRVGQLENEIDSNIGQPTVIIGAPPNDRKQEAKRQMESLIAWNALAASNCKVLAGVHAISGVEVDQRMVNEYNEIETSDKGKKLLRYNNISNWTGHFLDVYSQSYPDSVDLLGRSHPKAPVIRGNNSNAVYAFHGFEPLIKAGWDQECLGSQSVIDEITDEIQNQGNSLLEGAIDRLSSGIALANPQFWAIDEVLGSTPIGSPTDATAELTAELIVPSASQNLNNDVGFDMEGRYGRIEFEANRTFHMGDRYPQPIMGMNIKGVNPETGGRPGWKKWLGDDSPGFWSGIRFMYSVPPGLQGNNDDALNSVLLEPIPQVPRSGWKGPHPKDLDLVSWFDGQEKYKGFGDNRADRRMLYSWRVRMINQEKINEQSGGGDGNIGAYNIPLAAEDDELDNASINNVNLDVQRDVLRNLLRKTEWVICTDAEGYIQSNAAKMFNEGETQIENSRKEDNVYPMVKITQGATECLDPDNAKTRGELSYLEGEQVKDDLTEAFYSPWNDSEAPNFLTCQEKSQMGREDIIFSRGQYDGSTFESRFLCGGESKILEIDKSENAFKNDGGSPASDLIEVYTPKFKLDGCSQAYYDITYDSITDGEDLVWNHSTTYDYNADKEGLRDQIVYDDLHFRHGSNYGQNKTYGINISMEDNNKDLELIVSEEYPGDDVLYKAAEVSGSVSAKEPGLDPGQRFRLNLVGGVLGVVSGNQPYEESEFNEELLNLDEINETESGENIKRISVGKLSTERLNAVNDDIDDFNFSPTQGEISMNEVVAHGTPQICHKAIEE